LRKLVWGFDHKGGITNRETSFMPGCEEPIPQFENGAPSFLANILEDKGPL